MVQPVCACIREPILSRLDDRHGRSGDGFGTTPFAAREPLPGLSQIERTRTVSLRKIRRQIASLQGCRCADHPPTASLAMWRIVASQSCPCRLFGFGACCRHFCKPRAQPLFDQASLFLWSDGHSFRPLDYPVEAAENFFCFLIHSVHLAQNPKLLLEPLEVPARPTLELKPAWLFALLPRRVFLRVTWIFLFLARRIFLGLSRLLLPLTRGVLLRGLIVLWLSRGRCQQQPKSCSKDNEGTHGTLHLYSSCNSWGPDKFRRNHTVATGMVT